MFNVTAQQFLAYGIILTIGVLHGANDIILVAYITKIKNVKSGFSKALLYYMFTIAVVFLVFYKLPAFALVAFIVISTYHFGEQHFGNQCASFHWLQYVLFLSYGSIILFTIFYFNINKVGSIVFEISMMELTLAIVQPILMISAILFMVSLSFLRWKGFLKTNILEELFYLVVLFIVFRTADLIWAFGIYFVLWHSLPSLADQIRLLNGTSGISGFLQYLKSSWIYWAIAIVGLVVLYLIFQNDMNFFISVLIYFLAAITFPHVIVMSQLEKTKNLP